MNPVTVINLVSEETIEHRMLATLAAKQGLADGVLDGVGDLKQVKLRTGARAFMERLEQIMAAPRPAPGKPGKAEPEVIPVDRQAALAQRASELVGGRLALVEERYPEAGPHSVVVVVVEGDAASWRPRIEEMHKDLFGNGRCDPLAPVQLEVMDRATADALQRLADAGLVSTTIRATRRLYPPLEETARDLSDEEKQEQAEALAQAARKLKMARVLAAGELDDEARQALIDAVTPLGRSLAIRHRLPSPRDSVEALAPPLAPLWGIAAETLRQCLDNPGNDLKPAMSAADAVFKEAAAHPSLSTQK